MSIELSAVLTHNPTMDDTEYNLYEQLPSGIKDGTASVAFVCVNSGTDYSCFRRPGDASTETPLKIPNDGIAYTTPYFFVDVATFPRLFGKKGSDTKIQMLIAYRR